MDRENFERLLNEGAFESKTESSTVCPPDLSDAGNAEVFTQEHKGDLIFTDALGWLSWNGTVWERGDHKAESLAMEFTGKMLDESKREYAAALHNQADVKAQAAEGTATKQDVADAKETVRTASDYKAGVKGLTADKDANGNSIDGSKKAKVLDVINGMDLSSTEKDWLYLLNGYSANTIDEAPWR